MDYRSDNRRPVTAEERRARNTRRNKMRKRKQLIKLSLGLLVFVIFLTIFIVQRKTIAALNNSYKEQVDSQKRLKERVEGLQGEIKGINTLEYIEKRAREDLGMIKEDEKIYINEKDEDLEVSDDNSKETGNKDPEEIDDSSRENATGEESNKVNDQGKKQVDDEKKDNKKSTKKKKSNKKKKSSDRSSVDRKENEDNKKNTKKKSSSSKKSTSKKSR